MCGEDAGRREAGVLQEGYWCQGSAAMRWQLAGSSRRQEEGTYMGALGEAGGEAQRLSCAPPAAKGAEGMATAPLASHQPCHCFALLISRDVGPLPLWTDSTGQNNPFKFILNTAMRGL